MVPVERSGRRRRKKRQGIFQRIRCEDLGRRKGTKVVAGKHCRQEFPRIPERALLQMPLSRFLNRNSLFLQQKPAPSLPSLFHQQILTTSLVLNNHSINLHINISYMVTARIITTTMMIEGYILFYFVYDKMGCEN